MKFLVIGGGGYVGSHFVHEAIRRGNICVVFDNFERGHRQFVPIGTKIVEGDLRNYDDINNAIRLVQPDCILHYAAYALVGESVLNPEMYFENNVGGVKNLLTAMGVSSKAIPLIFSSTCAVFGTPTKLPISEDDPKNPESPYGESKLQAEVLMNEYSATKNVPIIALRYFNACGADHSGVIGELHDPETHLIPNVINAALNGSKVKIFGNNFSTMDGTCVRDYIHVTDLADAHLKAIAYLNSSAGQKSGFQAIHLGTGTGFSNLQIVDAVKKYVSQDLQYEFADPRPGDPPALVADVRKASKILGFSPRFSDLKSIITSAHKWSLNVRQE